MKALKEYVKLLLKEISLNEDSRTGAGDVAQKRLAAWLVDKGYEVSVNQSGSQSEDIKVYGYKNEKFENPYVIETKSGDKGLTYSQELLPGSEIADAINFQPGVMARGISASRFVPAKDYVPLMPSKEERKNIDEKEIKKIEEKIKKITDMQNRRIDELLSSDDLENHQIAFGGKLKLKLKKDKKYAYAEIINLLKADGTVLSKGRPVVILVVAGKAGDDTRLRFWSDVDPTRSLGPGNSPSDQLRGASGGGGLDTKGTYQYIDATAFTEAFIKQYGEKDHYFCIVSGGTAYIGTVGVGDPIGLKEHIPKLGPIELELSGAEKNVGKLGTAESFGGSAKRGLREKVTIKLKRAAEVINLPSSEEAEDMIKRKKLQVHGKKLISK